ncbi:uncharacterized protein LOC130543144 [Ursus arctos]|uniref:uncharacterized protein LOC130543144 n=1 Tax=Ursus arctos TaxID=9644 RepID=UPI002547146B|nr:uncharacterized protein LOC130543144 [Ursus arctos]
MHADGQPTASPTGTKTQISGAWTPGKLVHAPQKDVDGSLRDRGQSITIPSSTKANEHPHPAGSLVSARPTACSASDGTRASPSSGLCSHSLLHRPAEPRHRTSPQRESSRLTSRLQRGQRSQAAGNACPLCMRPGPVLYRRCAASCSQHSCHPCQSSPLHPRRATWRMSDTQSLCRPPRCQVKVLGEKKVLTHFLIHILQLTISFTIYENPKERPANGFFFTHSGLNLWFVKSVFPQLTLSCRNWFLLAVF